MRTSTRIFGILGLALLGGAILIYVEHQPLRILSTPPVATAHSTGRAGRPSPTEGTDSNIICELVEGGTACKALTAIIPSASDGIKQTYDDFSDEP